MKLPDVLYGVAGTTGMIGIMGIPGAIEFGTGWCTYGALLLICAVCLVAAAKEDGSFRQKNRPR